LRTFRRPPLGGGWVDGDGWTAGDGWIVRDERIDDGPSGSTPDRADRRRDDAHDRREADA